MGKYTYTQELSEENGVRPERLPATGHVELRVTVEYPDDYGILAMLVEAPPATAFIEHLVNVEDDESANVFLDDNPVARMVYSMGRGFDA